MTDTRPARGRIRRSAKFRYGCATAALISAAGIAAPAHAQMPPRGSMIVENAPHMRPGMIVENIPHAPRPPMIVENIPHRPQAPTMVENIPHAPPATMIVENIPHVPPGGMIVENIPHTPPTDLGLENIRISTPALVPGLNQPQMLPANTRVQATPVFPNADGSFNSSAALDNVFLFDSEAIIDWTLFDTAGTGDIEFLPQGRLLRYDNADDYVVLNRIIPNDLSRRIVFNGTVESRVNGVRGGEVWFYNPGGIVVSSLATFNVGSLLLTTSDIDTSGGLDASAGISFTGVSNPNSEIVIESGAQINAITEGSYVAMVAPRVEQRGTVTANGSVAYVAAEEAVLTINNGLFDIAVTVGTEDGSDTPTDFNDDNGIVHTGTTTGPASAPVEDPVSGAITNPDAQAIYMVAVPKNDAITMLVSGSMGYDPAADARFVNGNVVLSAGYNVSVGGSTSTPRPFVSQTPVNDIWASVRLGDQVAVAADTTFTADTTIAASAQLIAQARGSETLTTDLDYDLNLSAGALLGSGNQGVVFGNFLGGTVNIGGDVNLSTPSDVGNNFIDISVDSGGTVSIGGDLTATVSTIGQDTFTPGDPGEDIDGSSISINITQGGTLDVAGSVFLNANAQSGNGDGGRGLVTGGAVTINVSGSDGVGGSSTFSVGDSLSINAVSNGIVDFFNESQARIAVSDSSVIDVTNNITVDVGSIDGGPNSTNYGGRFDLTADNGSISFDDISVFAISEPAGGPSGPSGDGSVREGGFIDVTATNGGSISGNSGSFNASAASTNVGGTSAFGGEITLTADGGTIDFANFLSVSANGLGNGDLDPAAGFFDSGGFGGTITITVDGAAGVMNLGDVFFSSDGRVDVGIEGDPFVGDGASGRGGSITFDLLGGTFTADSLNVSADGEGGRGGGLSGGAPPTTLVTPAPLVSATAAPLIPGGISAPFMTGVSAGDGGDGTGGNVTMNLDGGSATLTNFSVTANGSGGSGAFGDIATGTFGGSGGNGIGGSATFNAISGSLTVTNTLTVSATGNSLFGGGEGGSALGNSAGDGGNGLGGSATFNLDGAATIDATDVIVSTEGFGGSGGNAFLTFDILGVEIPGGTPGQGGNGTGGDAVFNNTAGTLTFATLTVSADGSGGGGGSNFGLTIGDARENGADGGDGTGGTATINLNQNDLTDPVYIVSANGTGGAGGSGIDGGTGGDATGGSAAININDVQVSLDDPTIVANALGGAGGSPDAVGGAGGDGGAATGGTATLQVSGAGGSIDLASIQLEANATGGAGIGGYGTFGGGIPGGNGGSGGDANGGTVEIIARTGGTITLAPALFTMTSTGTGGDGGSGGYSYDSGGGDGGGGGDAIGGTARILAQGGTVSGNNLTITTAGLAGDGGAGGTYGAFGPSGADGSGGNGTGGIGVIEVQEGSPGIVTLANVSIIANGTGGGGPVAGAGAGGRIEITDSSTDPAGLITLDSLTVDAFDTTVATPPIGSASALLGGFFVSGNSGVVSILGDLTVNVSGNIEYAFDGDGQMTVGGNATLNSNQNILVDHTNNTTPVNSIDVGGDFTATAQLDFISSAGAIINAGPGISIRAEQNASANDLRAVTNILLSALQDATLNDATVSGPPITAPITFGTQILSGVEIRAGYDPVLTSGSYNPNFNAVVTGTVTSTGFVDIFAGGSAIFQTGANVMSDNGIEVSTGDDIIVNTGAIIEAGVNPADAPDLLLPFFTENNLVLDAGDLVTLLSGPPLTPIASIVNAGDINANAFAVALTADAIDGTDGTIAGGSIRADINNAPSNAAIAAIGQSDDAGLLSAPCLEGNMCLGAISADNRVEIGQFGVPVALVLEGGSVSANDILITTRTGIIIGTGGIASSFTAANQVRIESQEGDIDLRDTTISSDTLQIFATSGSLLGTGNLVSVNDVGVTVGADLVAASIDAGGQLTTAADIGGANETFYSVPGSIDVGSYAQGDAIAVNIDAGANISFGTISVPSNQNITLTAAGGGTGDVFLGSATGALNIALTGDNVGFGDLTAAIDVSLQANNGAATGGGITTGRDITISATDIAVGDLNAGINIDLDAAQAIRFADGTAVSTFTADAGTSIDFADMIGRDIQFTAGAAITGISAISPNVTGGIFDRVVLSAGGDVAVGTVRAIDIVNVTGAMITIGTLDTSSGTVTATGAVDIGTVLGRTHDIEGSSVALGMIDISPFNAITVNATAGTITSGNITAGNAAFTATGDVDLADAVVTSDFDVTAGGAITFGNITARDTQFIATGSITGMDVISPTSTGGIFDRIVLDAGGDVTVGNLSAIDIVDVDGAAITIGTLDTSSGTVTATGAVDIGSVLGRTHDIEGSSVALGMIDISPFNAITVNATAGTITSGNITAGNATFTATGNVDLADAVVTSLFDVTAGGAITFGNITARDTQFTAAGAITGMDVVSPTSTGGIFDRIVLNAGGNVTVGNLTAIDIVDVDGAAITIGILETNNGNVLGTGAVDTGALLGRTHIVQGTSVALGLIDVNPANAVAVTATTGDIVSGDVAAGNATFNAAGNVTFGDALITSLLDVNAGGDIAFGAVTARDTQFMAGGAINGTSILSPTSTGGIFDRIVLNAGGDIDVDTLEAIDIVDVDGANVTIGTIDSNSANVLATGAANIGTILGFTHQISGQSVRLDSGSISGTLTVAATAGDITGSGAITVGRSADYEATGSIGFGSLSAASIDMNAGDGIAGGDLDATSTIDLASGLGGFSGDQLGAGGAITIVTNGDIAFSDAVAGANIRLTSTSGGDILADTIDSATNVILRTAGSVGVNDIIAQKTGQGLVRIDAESGITIGSLTGNDSEITSTNGAIRVETDIDLTNRLFAFGESVFLRSLNDLSVRAEASAGSIDIETTAGLDVDGALATGDIRLVSTGGSVNVNATVAAPSSAPIAFASVAPQTITSTAGDITISAAGDAFVNADTVAAGTLFLDAGGLLGINALASGLVVSTSSSDLDIASTGQLGESDFTQNIEIFSTSATGTVLGGTGTAGVFSLDADEFTRIFSGGDLSIFSFIAATGGPSLIIEDLSLDVASGAGGSQDGIIGTGGTLSIATEGDMRVNGAFALNGATNGNTVSLNADQNIRVDAVSGNIALRDANGGLAGQLSLAAGTITAATDAAVADIAGASVFDIDARLANNDGIVRDDGFFQAGAIAFSIFDGLYIQNSASGTDFDDRRGFLVGDGGLSIAGGATGIPSAIVINGIQQLSTGTTITGIDMIAQTVITGPFDTASTINGCVITDPVNCTGAPPPAPPPPPPPPPPAPPPPPGPPPPPPPPSVPDEPLEPVQGLIEEEIEEEETENAGEPVAPLIETVDIIPNREGPVIDDPVTGSGNEDLWIRNPGEAGFED
ncbi:hypothetical protein [Parasphingopyxis sp.]|uniref:hypothetical protein n=1 Tax=Parasphingopyxis sp. TaxID=1920299 RepID=UPI00263800B1|nr:hypothetical protein [Parasphingopyxis sp.]